jgi:hypothetical protein
VRRRTKLVGLWNSYNHAALAAYSGSTMRFDTHDVSNPGLNFVHETFDAFPCAGLLETL